MKSQGRQNTAAHVDGAGSRKEKGACEIESGRGWILDLGGLVDLQCVGGAGHGGEAREEGI